VRQRRRSEVCHGTRTRRSLTHTTPAATHTHTPAHAERSASNYLLGLTPIQLGPLVLGTVAGMSVWSILYASLGGASKALLEGGADLDVLLAGEGARSAAGARARMVVCAGAPAACRGRQQRQERAHASPACAPRR
jgi:hypothetical protein